ncbi:MAG: phosphoenolpyruvate--protein phosphotransferase [Pseudomonadota bacterium]
MLKTLRRIVQEVNAAHDFGEALQIMVERVREAVETEACTVFLIDEATDELVAMATSGLNVDAVSKVRVKRNEGLVGLVAEREEPLNLEDAPSHPNFVYHPGLKEESYSAFLAVPIIHHRKLFGVIVLQQTEKRRFDEAEEAFLITVSAQSAGIIAHAEVTGAIKALFSRKVGRKKQGLSLEGIAACPGIAIGKSILVYPPADLDAVPDKKIKDKEKEILKFDIALKAARKQIETLGQRLSPNLPEEEQALFDVYLKILDGAGIKDAVVNEINQGQWAQGALRKVVQYHIRQFEAMEDSYLRERADDIKDLGLRILAQLQESQDEMIDYPPNTILLGENIPPAILAEVPEGRLKGIVSVRGSANSHVAILARALGVPAVMGVDGLVAAAANYQNVDVIVDGYYGQVYIEPSKNLRHEFTILAQEEQELDTNLAELRGEPATTPDGHTVPLFVNSGLAADAGLSLSVGAEGVGLYRTEVPFLVRDRFPTEEEQRKIYRQLLNAFSPRPVIMRTLDVGGDKELPYFPVVEENPFLGWRGIRLTLDHPDVFLVQLRAMLKASVGFSNLRIMLPMITSINEIDEALELINQAYDELTEEGFDIIKPPLGVMIEIPSAVYLAPDISNKVDFLSIGTNDLTQYILAVDRNNSRVANLYDSLHPAVLRALEYVLESGHNAGKKVSICGEMASDPAAVIVLLALGFDALSMSSVSLPRIKWVIRNIPMQTARETLKKIMQMDNPKIIRFNLEQLLEAHGLGGLIRAGK